MTVDLDPNYNIQSQRSQGTLILSNTAKKYAHVSFFLFLTLFSVVSFFLFNFEFESMIKS